jgi:hypothetical protein
VEGEPSRWPAIIGVFAMVAGAALMAVSAGSDPPRPRVLGEMLVATTTTSVAPATVRIDGSSPSTSRAPRVRQTTTTAHATSASSPAPTSTTTTNAPAAPSSPSSTSPSTSTTEPCPSGAPVADVGTWDSATDGDGTWHVTVTGVVVNRTGATVDVGPVAVTIERASGDAYVVPAGSRPTPAPSTIGDGGESTWRWEGDLPAGGEPTGAHAGVTDWSWVAAPPACGG